MHSIRSVDDRPFDLPEVIGAGESGRWHWLAFASLPARPSTSPRRPPLDEIATAIGRGLGHLPRETDTPAHWQPMHGDLTPWNLRKVSGRLWLIDWEEAGWGPPGADATYYRACRSWNRARPRVDEEVAAFWSERILARDVERDDNQELMRHLLDVFGALPK